MNSIDNIKEKLSDAEYKEIYDHAIRLNTILLRMLDNDKTVLYVVNVNMGTLMNSIDNITEKLSDAENKEIYDHAERLNTILRRIVNKNLPKNSIM